MNAVRMVAFMLISLVSIKERKGLPLLCQSIKIMTNTKQTSNKTHTFILAYSI